jgi:hypothetical protein
MTIQLAIPLDIFMNSRSHIFMPHGCRYTQIADFGINAQIQPEWRGSDAVNRLSARNGVRNSDCFMAENGTRIWQAVSGLSGSLPPVPEGIR